MADIAACFACYEWAAEEPEPGIWRTTFATEREIDFDLYVMAADEWVHFAVSPFLHGGQQPALDRLYRAILHFNQRMRMVRFGLDEDGDINLLADLPRASFNYDQFSQVMDALREYTELLAYDVGRIAAEPDYHSPLL